MWKSTTQLYRLARSIQTAANNYGLQQIPKRNMLVSSNRSQMELMKRSCYYQSFCSTSTTNDMYSAAKMGPTPEIIRHPLPEGVDGSKFGLYDLQGTARSMGDTKGEDAVLGVHGPIEQWAPYGLEGHGAEGGMFAVFAAGGTQHKVSVGDIVYTNKIEGEVNTTHTFEDVLLIGAVDWSVFGRPLIQTAKVLATIEEQTKSGKIYIHKFKKRKGYRRKMGHRQLITRFRIDEIVFEFPEKERISVHDVIPLDPRKPVPSHLSAF